MAEDMLVLVDENDNQIGLEEKIKCHLGEGKLHRAISAFLFNDKGQLLIQKRSSKKMLWPLFWSNTCCSHPREGEPYENAAQRRIMEELGVNAKVKFLYKFIYQVPFEDRGSENELCAVLIGKCDGNVKANPDEIDKWKFIDLDELEEEIVANPDNFTPWFRMELKELLSKYRRDIGVED